MKINIENYENMTPEEKLAALEAYDPEKDGFVSKATFDKASSEVASYKKQLREKQSDEEAKAAKEAEERATLIARVEELEREKTVNSYTTSLLGLGYDEKAAKATAEAMAKGDNVTAMTFLQQAKQLYTDLGNMTCANEIQTAITNLEQRMGE